MSTTTTRKGLLGTKLGMTQVWDENNKLIPVTVIQITPNVVTQVRTNHGGLWRTCWLCRHDSSATQSPSSS